VIRRANGGQSVSVAVGNAPDSWGVWTTKDDM
ncbi:uncharacterized protein METZ01_LOCUS347728, partial [marine metagenome]